MNQTDFGKKFTNLLDVYRKSDGSRWSLSEIENATSGFVKAPYLANLKAGRIKQPGVDRLRSIAHVMGFPPEMWLQDLDSWRHAKIERIAADVLGKEALTQKLNLLFEVLVNKRTGKPYTNKDVAAISEGQLTEREIHGIREGNIEDLHGAQYLALSKVFGVDIGYWYQGAGTYTNLTQQDLRAVADKKTHTILNKIYQSPESQKDAILRLLEEMEIVRKGGHSSD